MTTPAYLGMMGAPFQVLPEETSELAFEPEEYHARIQKVRRLMAEQKIDLLYVTSPEHDLLAARLLRKLVQGATPRCATPSSMALRSMSTATRSSISTPERTAAAGTKHSISRTIASSPRARRRRTRLHHGQLKAKGWLGGTVGHGILELHPEPRDQHDVRGGVACGRLSRRGRQRHRPARAAGQVAGRDRLHRGGGSAGGYRP